MAPASGSTSARGWLGAAGVEVLTKVQVTERGRPFIASVAPSFGLAVGSIVLDLEAPEKARSEMGWLTYAGQVIVDK